MQCPNCNNEVQPSARFCPHCGHTLPYIVNPRHTKQEFNASGCLAKTFILIVIFLAICVALAIFVLALPWMLLIGFIIIGISVLAFTFAGF